MNIKEISTIQAEDVPKDIRVTNIPTNEVCQEAAGGVIFSLIRRPRVLTPTQSFWRSLHDGRE